VLEHHLERLVAQNVVYAEIMLGTSELPPDDGRLVEAFREFREFVTGLEAGRIQVEFLVAVRRNVSLERLEWIVDRCLRLHEAGLLFGLALAGWPETPIRHLGPALRRAREAGLGIEIHAGEWAGPELVWDALEHGRPHRIGHGVSIFRDPRLIERVRRDGVHIEMCPTSNFRTGSVKRIEDHPVRKAHDFGLSFSLNTDDPGPFENSLESEYALAADVFGFEERDLRGMAANALAARFRPDLRYPDRQKGLLS
jgi:adenosine deaminase